MSLANQNNQMQYGSQDPPYYARAIKAEKDLDILQGRLIERTDQALHTARRDAETIRVLREALRGATKIVAGINTGCYSWHPSDFDEYVARWTSLTETL